MITAGMRLKIGDFGLSKTLSVRNRLPQDMSQAYKLTGETGSYRFSAWMRASCLDGANNASRRFLLPRSGARGVSPRILRPAGGCVRVRKCAPPWRSFVCSADFYLSLTYPFYPLPVVTFQMYHHQVPFEGMNPVDAARSAAFERRRPVISAGVNSALAAVIRECWDPNANARPTFEELISRLEAIAGKMVSPNAPKQGECCSVQ